MMIQESMMIKSEILGAIPSNQPMKKRGVTSPRWTFQEQQTIDQVTHFFGP
jgi:hypothetical protein